MAEVLQNNIDAVNEQSRLTGEPVMPHVNHPNFGYALSVEDMMALEGERFFEVYNGHPMVHNLGDSVHMSTEEMWDRINIAYLQSGKPLMYGLATDDSHHYHEFGNTWSNSGRGWVMVSADTLTPESLIWALESGSFYSTMGVELLNYQFDGSKIHIEINEEVGVEYTISLIGLEKGKSMTRELKSVKGSSAIFDLTKSSLQFARCKIISTKRHGNPIESLYYEMAWTQPVVPQ